jgi:hypothetical protein
VSDCFVFAAATDSLLSRHESAGGSPLLSEVIELYMSEQEMEDEDVVRDFFRYHVSVFF